MNHLPLHVRVPIEENNPSITRLEEKCIKCGMCKDVCTNAIGVHGTYVFMFPNDKAAEIAVRTVREYKKKTGSRIEVIFNVFKEQDERIYRELLQTD